MDSTHILVVALGGLVIAILGGAAEYAKDKQFPRTKGIMRDFIIGSIMTLLLFQLLPDSMGELSSSLPGLGSVGSLMSSAASFSGGAEPQLQVGIPKF